MNSNFQHWYHKALQNDRLAQKNIYEMFSDKMFAVAKSYVNSSFDAEDILISAFTKAFSKINECKNAESFPFWLRKIVINDSINFIRKNKNLLYADSEDIETIGENLMDESESEFPDFNVETVLPEMPLGYRLVFNLYVFEDKKHNEISEILNISEGTSKSQLSKAKRWLVEFFNTQENEKFNRK